MEKQEILENTNKGLEIFKYYIPALSKNGTSKNFKAIFRDDDKNASANVFLTPNGQIWCYKDFGTNETLNPFDFIMKLKNCNFKDAIEIINRDILVNASQIKPIEVIGQNSILDFNLSFSSDLSYWYAFAAEERMNKTLERYNVKSLQSYTYRKGAKIYNIVANSENPIFSFQISEQCYKIYRPFAKNHEVKHLWLGKKPENYYDLFGIAQLPESTHTLIIVEGLKDVIVANANGICAVGVDNATTKLNPTDLALIKKRSNNILICYDIDEVGLKASAKNATNSGFNQLILPPTLLDKGGKDISDFFSMGQSKEELNDLIQETLKSNVPTLLRSNDSKPINERKNSSKYEKVEQFILENYKLRYNEVSNQIEYKDLDNDSKNFEPLNENNIYRKLQHDSIDFSMAKLTSLLRSDFVPRFNPFVDYFENLPNWNPNNDLDYISKLIEYLPIHDIERFSIQFCKALVRTIACALNDSIINKQALILVHEEQNSGKSTFIRWLCPPILDKYIAENISTDKDSLISLCENLIINQDELATLSKAEINSLKSIFSKDTVKVRRPYDKNASSVPRRASFFGSTNKGEFLTDETGSVRWLCFELLDKINWDYKKGINIDDVWRQAYYLYKSGFKYELTPKEIQENEIANQQYLVTTQELELIQKHFEQGTKEQHDYFFTATDFLNQLIEKYPTARLNINNIGKALKILRFEKGCVRTEKYPIKGYFVNQLKK